jgi:alpha-tubulin suppressor-like RCC1 family protein
MNRLAISGSNIRHTHIVLKFMRIHAGLVLSALLLCLFPQLQLFQTAFAAGAPTISSVTPASGPTTGGTTTNIIGTGFFKGKAITDIDAGGQHTCAIADGKAYCWGVNESGQLGNGTTSDSTTPVPASTSGVLSGKIVSAISASVNHTCAIADSRAYCWGSNTDGKLGNGTTNSSTVPTAVGGILANKNVTDISTSIVGDYTCAIAEGKAYCWGSNMWATLGDGTQDYDPHPDPVLVKSDGVLAGKTVSAISAGSGHACVIAQNMAYCWGNNEAGSLGDGTVDIRRTPVAVNTSGALNGKTVTNISAETATCVVADAKAYCWGNGQGGRLGNGSTEYVNPFPLAVTSSGALNGKLVTDISARGGHTCALASGASYCWGNNVNGELGNGTTTSSSVPIATTGLPSSVNALASGNSHSCAATTESIYCWGLNNIGQIGDGTSNNTRTSPVTTNTTIFPTNRLPQVTFGGTSATSVTFNSATSLSVTSPAHSAGTVTVSVINPDGQAATRANGFTYQTPVTPPDAPHSLSASPVDSGVHLTWGQPASDGGSVITDYKIEYSSTEGASWQTFTRPATADRYATVSGLSTGVTYLFRVSALNSAGTSPPSSTTTGQTTYLTVSSSAAIAIVVTPTSQARTSSSSHTVSTDTNSPNGYTLSVSTSDTNRSLTNGTQTVAPTSGTPGSPGALESNSWGFRVPNIAGFASGGSTEDNVETSTYSWAGVPAFSSPAIIKTTSAPAQNSQTTIYYAMQANSQKPSGTYSGTIVYTAITN